MNWLLIIHLKEIFKTRCTGWTPCASTLYSVQEEGLCFCEYKLHNNVTKLQLEKREQYLTAQ